MSTTAVNAVLTTLKSAALPEILLASSAVITLLLGCISRHKKIITTIGLLVIVAMTALGFVYSNNLALATDHVFGQSYLLPFKLLILIGMLGGAASLACMPANDAVRRFEVVVLLTLSALGMFMAMSSVTYSGLYIGLELQSLPAYVLCAMRRDNAVAAEASVKYFINGAFASGLLLFGVALIYATTGTLNMAVLADIANPTNLEGLAIARVGAALVLAGLAFKASAAPMHMWTPDVYQAAPLPVVTFLASAGKVSAFVVMLQQIAHLGANNIFVLPCILLAIVSAVAGLAGAVGQRDIRRLLAFSSVQHAGFILLLMACSSLGMTVINDTLMLYAITYLPATILAFVLLSGVKKTDGTEFSAIADFNGLAKTAPRAALGWTVALLSMAGVPPMAGFFAKFAVVRLAMQAGFVAPALFLVLLSAIAAYYYLRVVRAMYFEEPAVDAVQISAPLWVRIFGTLLMLVLLLFWLLTIYFTPSVPVGV